MLWCFKQSSPTLYSIPNTEYMIKYPTHNRSLQCSEEVSINTEIKNSQIAISSPQRTCLGGFSSRDKYTHISIPSSTLTRTLLKNKHSTTFSLEKKKKEKKLLMEPLKTQCLQRSFPHSCQFFPRTWTKSWF